MMCNFRPWFKTFGFSEVYGECGAKARKLKKSKQWKEEVGRDKQMLKSSKNPTQTHSTHVLATYFKS